MRKITLLFILFFAFTHVGLLFGQSDIWTHTFETSGGYTTSDGESTDGYADYFTRTDGSDISATLTGKEGDYFFAVQDKDAAPTPVGDPAYLDFSSIDISGQTGLVFYVLLAEDDAGDGNEDWDVGDYVHILYQIDGGGYNNMIWIENDGSSYNTAPLIDADFDGNGDGAEITDTFTEYSFSIPETGSLLDIRIEFGGLTSGDEDIAIDQLRIAAGALPVELTSFTANSTDAGVVLNWSTATEVNNYGFDIERSTAKDVWETIGFVEGHGNSNSPQEYSFVDNSAIGDVSYRLKQIDFDGGYEYSDVVTVSGSLSKTELFQNHPNPFNPSTQISFTLAEAGAVNVSVYNTLGQKVAELVNQKMNAGMHNVEFNASNLASGFYFYKLETPNYSKTMKMILLR